MSDPLARQCAGSDRARKDRWHRRWRRRQAGIDLSTRDILDIGSGTGFYVDLWKRLGARSITGSDFAPFAVRALANIRSRLRTGGYFVLSENFLGRARETGLHQVSRTYAEIVEMLAENDFEVVRRAPVFVLMNRPLKSTSALLAGSWKLIKRVTRMTSRPYLGDWLGAALFPLELASVRLKHTGPSTEMMICRAR